MEHKASAEELLDELLDEQSDLVSKAEKLDDFLYKHQEYHLTADEIVMLRGQYNTMQAYIDFLTLRIGKLLIEM